MLIEYIGKFVYNSMNVKGFQPNTSRIVSEEVGTYLIKTFSKEFSCLKEEVQVSEKVEEVDTIKVEKLRETKSKRTKRGEKNNEEINIDI